MQKKDDCDSCVPGTKVAEEPIARVKEEPRDEFDDTPDGFLKNVYMIPYNFDMPEKPLHGKLVDKQLKYDMFNMTYNKIRGLLMGRLKDDDDYFKLKQIDKISCETTGFVEKLLTKRYLASATDKYLCCESWTIDMNGKQDINFKVDISNPGKVHTKCQ